MTQSHEQLTRNVNVTREKLDNARVKRLESVKLHKRHKVLAPALWVVGSMSGILISMTFPVWVIALWLSVLFVTCYISARDLRSAKDDIEAWRENELKYLSEVTENIQALVERETLALMNPEAYAAIEREHEEEQRKKQEILQLKSRGVYRTEREARDAVMQLQAVKSSRYKYQNYYSDHTHFYWTEMQEDGRMLYKRKKFMGDDEEIVSVIEW